METQNFQKTKQKKKSQSLDTITRHGNPSNWVIWLPCVEVVPNINKLSHDVVILLMCVWGWGGGVVNYVVAYPFDDETLITHSTSRANEYVQGKKVLRWVVPPAERVPSDLLTLLLLHRQEHRAPT
jgi:hypothetical protein